MNPTKEMMKLTNDCYVILVSNGNWTEKYYRDKKGWIKISAKGKKYHLTAEQVLNHILPVLSGIKPPNTLIEVEHNDKTN
jgi:hypothetical protein